MKETNCKAERQEIERKIAGAGKVGSKKGNVKGMSKEERTRGMKESTG